MATVVATAATVRVEAVTPLVYARTAYHPEVSDIAAVLRVRTYDSNNVQLGTFTADTRPTAVQVQELIEGAVSEVKVRIGDDIPTRLNKTAKQAVVLNTAAAIERSYYSEQAANRDTSAYQLFKDDYTDLMGHLVESVADPTVGTKGVVSVDMQTTIGSNSSNWIYYEELLP